MARSTPPNTTNERTRFREPLEACLNRRLANGNFSAMITAIRRVVLGRGVRRLGVVLVAVAFLAAGTGAGHFAPKTDGQTHHLEASHSAHHAPRSAALHDHGDCHDPANSYGSGPSSKHGIMHGCCASACFPSFTSQEFDHTARRTFSVERLTPRSDQAIASSSLNGLFKPPRRHG